MTAIVSQKLDLQKYARLVARATPVVIETEAEFESADAEIGRLLRKGAQNLSLEENRLLMLLSRLIEIYEEETFPTPISTPQDVKSHAKTRSRKEKNKTLKH